LSAFENYTTARPLVIDAARVKIKLRLQDSVQSGEPSDAPESPETVGDVLDTISATDNPDYPAIPGQVMETLQA